MLSIRAPARTGDHVAITRLPTTPRPRVRAYLPGVRSWVAHAAGTLRHGALYLLEFAQRTKRGFQRKEKKKKKLSNHHAPNQNTQRQAKAEERGVVELRGRNGPHRRTAHQDRLRGTPRTQHTAPKQAQCRNKRRRTSRWCCDAAP